MKPVQTKKKEQQKQQQQQIVRFRNTVNVGMQFYINRTHRDSYYILCLPTKTIYLRHA